jgi:hypothetical protein
MKAIFSTSIPVTEIGEVVAGQTRSHFPASILNILQVEKQAQAELNLPTSRQQLTTTPRTAPIVAVAAANGNLVGVPLSIPRTQATTPPGSGS